MLSFKRDIQHREQYDSFFEYFRTILLFFDDSGLFFVLRNFLNVSTTVPSMFMSFEQLVNIKLSL